MSKVSLKYNIAANYISQIYVVIISIITLPQLIEIMGAESYGLVAFFSMMQSWLMLLDLGMSPTLSREISRFSGGALDVSNLLHLFNALRKIFTVLALVCFVLIVCFSKYIALNWLKVETLENSVVIYAVVLMGASISCRWVTGFYKAATVGFEQLVWLSGFNSAFATCRFLFVFPVLFLGGSSPVVFFIYQLIISVIELIVVTWKVKKLMPTKTINAVHELRPLKEVLRFSLTIAFTSAIWVIVTQTDKLILSRLLNLSEFGFFSLAVQVAGGITLVSGPISSAILPRLARLEAEGKHTELISLYRQATQLIVIVAGCISLVLIFFSRQFLFAWTGDAMITNQVAPYLELYAIGNFFLAIAAFPYYLQYAKGDLKMHLYGNIGFVVFLIPSLIYIVYHFGGIGAGYVWISVNFIYLFLWIPLIHNKFERGLNAPWYFHDILRVIVPAAVIVYGFSLLFETTENRIYNMAQIAGAFCLFMLCSVGVSPRFRSMVMGGIHNLRSKIITGEKPK